MANTTQQKIDAFLECKRFAVVGASQNRAKYGNKVLRAYLANRREAVPIHPASDVVEGLDAYPDLASAPTGIDAVSIITPPAVTERVVNQALELGIKHIWMQPGAESEAAIDAAERAGANVIAGGPCLLVEIGYGESVD